MATARLDLEDKLSPIAAKAEKAIELLTDTINQSAKEAKTANEKIEGSYEEVNKSVKTLTKSQQALRDATRHTGRQREQFAKDARQQAQQELFISQAREKLAKQRNGLANV